MTDKRPTRDSPSAEPTLGARRKPPSGKTVRRSESENSRKSAPGKGGNIKRGKRRGSDRQSRQNAAGQRQANRSNKASNTGARTSSGNRNQRPSGPEMPAGLRSRHMALTVLESVIRDGTNLDTAISTALADERFAHLEGRDRAFARLLAAAVLRHHASLQTIIDTFLSKPLADNAERIRIILQMGAAELTMLSIAPHATISNAVELTRLSKRTLHFDKLANAVLRRTSETGKAVLAKKGSTVSNFPEWMVAGWRQAYGEDAADRIAAASLREAALDLTVKNGPIAWAAKLEALVLPTGTIRRASGGRIEDLEGYGEGCWWVQDAAAALPVKLLGAQAGERVLDLCAAPGGKTAQLCAIGANVTALEVSPTRIERLSSNLKRLGLEASIVAADATTWRSLEPFDRVLIDAPCTATGTIRRHPDILHLKREGDVERLAELQQRMLRNAAGLVALHGTLVYCTCSLEPAECADRIDAFIANPGYGKRRFERCPIDAAEIGNQTEWITPAGDLRTLPFHLPNENSNLAGMDGFYAARLVRTA